MKTYWGARIRRADSKFIRLLRSLPVTYRYVWAVRIGNDWTTYCVIARHNPYSARGKARQYDLTNPLV
jgi:hypothetical protein